MEINELLKTAISRKASDLHIKVGSPPMLRIAGELAPIDTTAVVTQQDALNIASAVMSPMQREVFSKKNEVDLAYTVQDFGRFRCNAFLQRGNIGLVFRVISMKIPTIEELLLPEILKKLAMEQRGLVLVTGTTGSGKSTTLASMIDYINANRTCHIITVEDPIEYIHNDRKSIVNQREIGTDTDTFSYALRSALRQDPDVILVGEMRDFETIETALVAAETGHLVFSTLHTSDTAETVNRIISVFPPYQHKQVRMQLSSVIKGIISMRLLPRADGQGRVPAVEVLLATATIRDCILEADKTKNIPDVVAQGKILYGMQTFDQSLFDLYKSDMITFEEALRWATNPDDFKLKTKGIQSTSDMTYAESAQPKEQKKTEFEIDRFSK